MTGNPDPRPPLSNLPEYTVGEISGALRRTVEETYGNVRVRGEVSGFKRHGSGHLYFCLKDTEAVLDAVCWRGQALRLDIRPEDGLEVICTGRLTTYPGRSKYQMVVERIELAGVGALLKLLEERKRRLASEGLFDPARKKKLPFLPEVIGVITSPTGAVIQDILHRLAERFPRRVLLWPVPVQGEGAAERIAAAIAGFNALPPGGRVPRPDLLIVARGGGSLEDLWAFNEEIVVRAAAASRIPLIAGVGHETDTTLIDFAADLRAPTPTGAAEKAVPVRLDLVAQIQGLGGRLLGSMARNMGERRARLEGLARGLPNPRRLLDDHMRRLDDRAERLANALPNLLHRRRAALERLAARLPSPREQIQRARHRLERGEAALGHAIRLALRDRRERLARQILRPRPLADEVARGARALDALGGRLDAAAPRLVEARAATLERCFRLLESYSYRNVLARGFALVRDGRGEPVTSAAQVRPAQPLAVQFHDGSVTVVATGEAPRKPKPSPDGRQGSLL